MVHVLLASVNNRFQGTLRMILKRNYNVFSAENGHAAIKMVKQIPMDAVTDIEVVAPLPVV